MLWELKDYWQQRRLEMSQSRTERAYEREIRDAKISKKSGIDVERIVDDQRFEWRTIEDEIQMLKSKRLLKRARHLSIPAPDFEDATMWEQSNVTNAWLLTMKGQNTLRSMLRVERKERTEGLKSWLPALAAGVSAIAAWVAALKR